MRWFSKAFWRYLLKDCKSWEMFWCRAGGHKPGPTWFNPGGVEPDMHCRGCGENIG
jgi:hypothetical protein